jgi:hypothetical protein
MISRQGAAYAPVLIGALFCVLLVRFRLLGFFYLLPLGIIAARYGPKSAWICLFAAALGNGLWSAGVGVFSRYPWVQTVWGIVHFSLTAAAFTWVMAPPPGSVSENQGKNPLTRIPTVYRFVIASCFASLLLLPMLTAFRNDTAFSAFIRSQVEALSAAYISTAGADVVEQSLLERYLTPDAVLGTLVFAALRGGVAASCMVFFFINRQIAVTLVRLFRRTGDGGKLKGFHVPRVFIWALSFSLLTILAGKIWKITPLEIMAWNGLVICSILYLAQGGGITVYFLAHSSLPPLMKLLLNFLLFLLIFSPGINAILLGGLVLLGIVENWVPFRAPKINGPSSTPGM